MSNVLSLFHVDTKVELNQVVAMILYISTELSSGFERLLIFGMLLLRSIREPEYRHRISERFGLLSSELSTDCICFHTVFRRRNHFSSASYSGVDQTRPESSHPDYHYDAYRIGNGKKSLVVALNTLICLMIINLRSKDFLIEFNP